MSDSIDRMFLGTALAGVIPQMRQKYRDAFDFAEALNEYSNKKLLEITATRTNKRHVTVAALVPRLLTAYQGCVLLAERGLASEATLLARKVLEVTFKIVAIAKSEETATRYIEADEVSRREILKKLRNLTTVTRTPEEQQSIVRLHLEVATAVNAQKLHAPTTRHFAEWAGLLDYYNTAYAYFSQAAHATVRDLETTLELDLDGDPVAFRYGPSEQDQPLLLNTASEAALIALGAVFELFSVETTAGLRHLHRRLQNMLQAPSEA
jgi:hypothetical protein